MIPNAILETKARLGQAMLEEDDRERRNLLASAKASIDWLIDHFNATATAYQSVLHERSHNSKSTL